MEKDIKRYYEEYLSYNNITKRTELIIQGTRHVKQFNWFKILREYEVFLPEDYKENIKYLVFRRNRMHVKYAKEYVPVFLQPIYYKKDKTFRLFPGNPRYAINREGKVLDIIKEKEIKPIMEVEYPIVNLTFPSKQKAFRVHRMVAITWIDNISFEKYPIVDHIDGNKKNFNVTNLRWVSPRQNVQFAVYQDLRTDNIPVVLRDIDTKEIREFPSFSEACSFMGRSKFQQNISDLRPGKIWVGRSGRYEIKYKTDDSGWYFDKFTIKSPKLVRYIFKAIEKLPNGKTKTRVYKSPREAYINLLDEDPIGMLDENVIAHLKNDPRTENFTFEYAKMEGFEAYNGKHEYKARTAQLLSDMIGIPKSTIIKYTKTGTRYKEWVFRRTNTLNKEWVYPSEIKPSNRNVKILVIDAANNHSQTIYPSLRSTAATLNIDRKQIKNEKRYKNYYFRFIEE